MSEQRSHRKYSPSQSERIILCPGATNLCDRLPKRAQSSYAKDGEVAHEVLHVGLHTYAATARDAIDNSIYFCQEFPIDFINAIETALDYIWGLYESLNLLYGDVQIHKETFVNPPSKVAPGETGGYCDVFLYSPSARKLWVIDYKHGIGVVKEALDNTQALQYAGGVLYGDQEFRVDPATIDDVTLVIIQPRAFHPQGNIRESVVTPQRVWEYLQDYDTKVALAQDPTAPLNPGYEQCHFCDARSSCPALEAKVMQIFNPSLTKVEQLNADVIPNIEKLDMNRLVFVADSFELMRLFMKGVESHIDELLRMGIPVPGRKLVETYAQREWYGDEKERIQKLAALIGCDQEELYNKAPKPLTEVEKMITNAFKQRVGKGRKKTASADAKQLFAHFTLKKPSGNLTVVKADDPRPPVNRAIQAFGDLPFIAPPTINK